MQRAAVVYQAYRLALGLERSFEQLTPEEHAAWMKVYEAVVIDCANNAVKKPVIIIPDHQASIL